MPRTILYNNAKSTLSVAVSSNTQATLTLQSGHGVRFPSPANPEYFPVTLDDGTNIEICECIARSTDTLTVLRGMEGTTAQASFATGTRVELRLTEDSLDSFSSNFRRMPRLHYIQPTANVTSWHVFKTTLPSVVNSQIAGTLTNSSFREQNERIRHACAGSASSPIHFRLAQPAISRQVGFRAGGRFGFALVPNSSHWFMGFVNTTGQVASVHPPSSLKSAIAIGYDNGALGSELAIYCVSSNAAGIVKRALGSYFTVNTQAWYEFEFSCQPNQDRIDYWIRRLDISSIAPVTSYFAADLPPNSVWLSPYFHGCTMVNSGMGVENGGFVWEM